MAQDPLVTFSTEGQSDPDTGLPLTAEEFIAATLVGAGVTIENVEVIGDPNAYGVFINNNDITTSKFGFKRGIVLSSGCIEDVPGPNDSNITAGTINSECKITPVTSPDIGDPDLTNLAQVITKDALILNFDFTTIGDKISFNYIFASEEYENYVCADFNDVFGFFISGPNPDGTDYVKENIALIPGTQIPISINTVNVGTVGSLGDIDNISCDLGYSNFYGGVLPEIQYEGATVILTAQANVVPCQTYSLKLAIADGFDDVLDSGVFLQAGSITSPQPVISQSCGFVSYEVNATGDIVLDVNGDPIPLYTDENENPIGILLESCGEKDLTFSIDNLAPGEQAELNLSLSGTAINGTDYIDDMGNPLPDNILLTADNPTQTIKLIAVVDALPEGIETIIINIESINGHDCLANSNLQPDTLYINDDLLDVLPTVPSVADSFLFDPKCSGAKVIKFLDLVGFDSVRYEPSAPILARGSDPNSATNVEAFIEINTTFKVYLFNGPCTDSVYIDEIKITEPQLANAPNLNTIYSICDNDPFSFNFPIENEYTWPTDIGLDCIDCPSPTFTPSGSNIEFDLDVKYADGCKDSVYKVQITYDNVDFLTGPTSSVFLCGAEPEQVVVSGGNNYTWIPSDSLSCSDCPNPFITLSQISSYQVISENVTGCLDTLIINVQPAEALANAGEDTGSCEIVDNIQIGNDNYPPDYKFTWTPAVGLNDPNIPNPTVFFQSENGKDTSRIYQLLVESPEGCVDTDEVEVFVEGFVNISIDKGDAIKFVIGQSEESSVRGLGSDAEYKWEPERGIDDPTSQTVIAKPTESTTYTVSGTSKFGCVAKASIDIEVVKPPSLKWPTAFSPNGDEMNDYFTFKRNDVQDILSFKIVSRWGETVYDGSSNGFIGWDGKRNGVDQPIGVYVFVVEFLLFGAENSQVEQGHFTLIR